MNRTGLFFVLITLPILIFAQTQRWVYNYNGPANSTDIANMVVYGSDGNIYTAGLSDNTSYNNDFVVISVTASGNHRWTYRYNSTANMDDGANSIVYGADGNIYAAGYSWISNYDILVISLTASGTQRWVYRYNGPGNMHDIAYSVIYGLDGNIYVAGYSTGTSQSYDFTVISLTASGTERWVYRYNSITNGEDIANQVVYGNDGNIYAVGNISGIAQDFAIVSITPTGNQRWLYIYNGQLNSNDYGWSISYGLDENLYACGFTVGKDTSEDYFVISVTNMGAERWTYEYHDSIIGTDQAYHIIYGADNNIYTAGFTTGNGFDFTVISLTALGTERWVYRYNGLGNDDDEAYALAYGTDGNIYVAGYTRGDTTDNDFTVIGLTRSGTERWLYTKNGTGNYFDYAYSITCGQDNNIYVAGLIYNDTTFEDIAVISLTPGAGIEEHPDFHIHESDIRITISTFQHRNLSYTISTLKPMALEFSLYNIQGEKILSWQVSAPIGTSYHTKTLPGRYDHELSSGIYFIRAENKKGYFKNKKLIIWK